MALTGTPGTGKSTVAGLLPYGDSVVEVGELARRARCARSGRDGLVVDLGSLTTSSRRDPTILRMKIVVGHLSHLLPIEDVVVLRCHPGELRRRLSSAHRGTARDRSENVLAEAIGVITAEAVARRRTVFEVDTTGRSPVEVTREVRGWIEGRRIARWGRIDWLREPSVTEHLLEWSA